MIFSRLSELSNWLVDLDKLPAKQKCQWQQAYAKSRRWFGTLRIFTMLVLLGIMQTAQASCTRGEVDPDSCVCVDEINNQWHGVGRWDVISTSSDGHLIVGENWGSGSFVRLR